MHGKGREAGLGLGLVFAAPVRTFLHRAVAGHFPIRQFFLHCGLHGLLTWLGKSTDCTEFIVWLILSSHACLGPRRPGLRPAGGSL